VHAVRASNARCRRSSVQSANGLAQPLRLLHGERDELVAYRRGVRRGTSAARRVAQAVHARGVEAPHPARAGVLAREPGEAPAAVAESVGSSSSARITHAR
jgi:hypothetical protein